MPQQVVVSKLARRVGRTLGQEPRIAGQVEHPPAKMIVPATVNRWLLFDRNGPPHPEATDLQPDPGTRISRRACLPTRTVGAGTYRRF